MGVETFEVCGWEWVKTGKSKIGRWTCAKKNQFQFFLPEDVILFLTRCIEAKPLELRRMPSWFVTQ
jgi:hypothetical protein